MTKKILKIWKNKWVLKEKKKIIISSIILFFLFLSIAVLSETYLIDVPKKGGVINEIIIGPSPRFINPVIAISQSEKNFLPLIFSSLLKRDYNGNLINNIAEVTLKEDKKTYNIKLKENIKFSDGQRLTSDDIIFTIKMIQDPLIRSPLAGEFIGVSYRKISDFELELILEKEFAQFKNTLANLYILPKKLWKHTSYAEFPFANLNIYPIGSGPFMVSNVQRSPTGEIIKYELIKNKYYFKNKEIFLNKVVFYFFQNLSEYKNSEIFLDENKIKNISMISPSELDFFIKNKNVKIKNIISPKIFALFLQKENKFLKNENIRELIAISIDRDEIINNALQGRARPINSIVFNQNFDNIPKLNKKEYILKQLKKDDFKINNEGFLMTKEGKIIKLNFGIINSSEFKKVANIIQQQLKNSGIKTNIIVYNENKFIDEPIRNRDFDILFFGYKTNLNPNFFHIFHSSQSQDPGLNISQINKREVDELIMKLRTNLEKEEYLKNLEKLNKLILETKLLIPIYNPYFIYIVDNRINNFKTKLILSIEERFNHLHRWYIKTKKILPF